jgi:hypothetical protein
VGSKKTSKPPEPVVLVDARNVQRSRWPNFRAEELVRLIGEWADGRDVRAVAIFDGGAPGPSGGVEVIGTGAESADDWLIRETARLRAAGEPFWIVTSDRALRSAAGHGAERVIGGGSFAKELQA